jgi:hypothetical protein
LLERPVVIDTLTAFPLTGTRFVGAGAEAEVLMKAADDFLFLNHGVSP